MGIIKVEKIKATGAYKSLLVAFFFPIIGGILIFLKKRGSDLGKLSLILSVLSPPVLVVGIDLLFPTISSFWFIVFSLVLFFILTIGLMRIFSKNIYRYFIPTWYFSFLGVLYSVYKYRNSKPLQVDVEIFFLVQFSLTYLIFKILLFLS